MTPEQGAVSGLLTQPLLLQAVFLQDPAGFLQQPQVQIPGTLCSATLNLSSIFLDVGPWLIQALNPSEQNSLSWRPNPWVLKLESSRLDSLAHGGFLKCFFLPDVQVPSADLRTPVESTAWP